MAASMVRWNSQGLQTEIKQAMYKRMLLVGETIKNAHVKNLSKPVRKINKKRRRSTSRGAKGTTYTYADPATRSKAGEYPRADTTNLMKNIFADVDIDPAGISCQVGTPTDYGAELELKAGRLGLRATLIETLPMVRKIILMRGMESSAFIFK